MPYTVFNTRRSILPTRSICPYLQPIGSGVLAGFVQADQPAECAITVALESGRSDIEASQRMPSGWASVFSTYSMLSTSSAVYFDRLLVVGCLGELERVIFLFQYGGFGVPTALQVTVDFRRM